MEDNKGHLTPIHKAIILIGGQQHQKGNIFRPLSLDLPTPLFPVAGRPLVQHQIELCLAVPSITEVLLIGCYPKGDAIGQFINGLQGKYPFIVRYLQEFTAGGLGTAGGLYHFRDQILSGDPEAVFILNCDVCCDFPLEWVLDFYHSVPPGSHVLTGVTVSQVQSRSYGCIVTDPNSTKVLHYAEKPETYVSSLINSGFYLISPNELFSHLGKVFREKSSRRGDNATTNQQSISAGPLAEVMSLENDFIAKLAGSNSLHVMSMPQGQFWSQIKTAGCAIYASKFYLSKYRTCRSPSMPLLLADQSTRRGPQIIGDVWIDDSAQIDSTARLGPNVCIGAKVEIGPGVRVKESIILSGARIEKHTCILYSVIGWSCHVGAWSRVEGLPNTPDPNDPNSRPRSDTLFDSEGKLLPSTTILGQDVRLSAEKMLLNCIVLPHKSISASFMNQIIL